MNYKSKILLISIISIFLINNSNLSSFAINDAEEEIFTQAENIGNETLEDNKDRSYDAAVTIKSIEIEGNNLVNKDKILPLLKVKEGSKFDRNVIQQDLRTIYNTGYFSEKIKANPEVTDSGITLKITVEENVPITGFSITGNKAVSTEEIAEILDTQTGLPQNINELNNTIKQIEDLYAQKGYILSRVTSIIDDPDGVINIEINEGYINNIKITGNTKTRDYVIKRNILTVSGDIYNENLLKQDLSRIFSTQAFGDVRRVISVSPEKPDTYDLTIEVDEKRTGSISVGGGIDTSTGLFGSVGYVDKNLMGRGQELSVSFMAGSGIVLRDTDVVEDANIQIEAYFLEPRFKQTLNSLEIRAFGKELSSYQVPLAIEQRFGGNIEVARPIKRIPHLAGSISVGFEDVNIKEGNYDETATKFAAAGVDITKRADQLVGGTFLSISPSLVYDTRNNFLNPTSGFYASSSFGEYFSIAGDAGSYNLVTGTIRKFFPVGKKSTITVGGKFGVRAFDDMPEFATFRLGGATTVRGFREGDLGNGQGFMLASAELRTPVPFMDKITEI
ncbi:MAG: POTRA domain-containing protein, partial [Candidatus Gastranaerophilales bacterium]|nr:POTRA domain-containing protein [Candidatus Gastranaerophilales bacterium]